MKPQVFNEPVVIKAGNIQITLLGHTIMQVEHEYEPGASYWYGSGAASLRDADRVVSSTITLTVHPKAGADYLYEVRRTDGQCNDHADPGQRVHQSATKDQRTPPDRGVLRQGKHDDPQWYRKAALER